MKRRLLILATVIAIATTAIVLLIGVAGAAEGETSRVRMVHAVPQGPSVQVLIDGETAYPSVSYAEVTTYTSLAPGLHSVEIKLVFPDIRLVSETLPVPSGADLTVIGLGTIAAPTVTVLADNNTLPNKDTVRVVHVAPNTAAMTVLMTGTMGTAEIPTLPYKEASDYVGGLGAGELGIEVRAGGVAKALNPPSTTLQSNAIHTLFIMGMGNQLDLVAAVDRSFEYKAYLPLIMRDGAGD